MLRICSIFVLTCLALPAQADPSGAIRVIDGDTIMVGKTKVRLHGIDAPELGQPCTDAQGVSWDCGTWVAREVRARWQGQRATCTTRDRDRYGRAVATCHVGQTDIGRSLVSDGLALAYRKYSMAYDLDEKAAVVAGRGLHGHEMQRPSRYRNAPTPDTTTDRAGCVIKGNISRSGNRIYHVPGQEHYDRTRIRTEYGERWFCSESEARRAGWRKARR